MSDISLWEAIKFGVCFGVGYGVTVGILNIIFKRGGK